MTAIFLLRKALSAHLFYFFDSFQEKLKVIYVVSYSTDCKVFNRKNSEFTRQCTTWIFNLVSVISFSAFLSRFTKGHDSSPVNFSSMYNFENNRNVNCQFCTTKNVNTYLFITSRYSFKFIICRSFSKLFDRI